MKINKAQNKIISSFCNDTAKGVMVAIILGQGLISTDIFETRIYLNLVWFIISILFFSLAIFVSKSV